VLRFNLGTFLKTFFERIWAILWFPVNWSRSLEWWMVAGLAAGIAGSLVLVWVKSTGTRVRLAVCMAAVVVACVPTHHMLLIGPSLERARYLDFATPAFVLLLAFACFSLPRSVGAAALGMIVVFHVAALEHNLRIWYSVTTARYELCRTLAGRARQAEGVVTISDVPPEVDGVYWRNGIEDCLFLDFGIPMGKVRVNGTSGY
jgi:hypothetical protein